MANTPRSPRSARRFGRPVPTLVIRPKVERLEDRAVPSISLPLSGFDWNQFGPNPVVAQTGTNPQPTSAPGNLPVAGRVAGVAAATVLPGATPAQIDAASNIVYAATTGGGLAKSIDGGQSWTHLFDNLPNNTFPGADPADTGTDKFITDRSLRTGAVTVDPNDPNTIWVGGGNPGFTDVGAFGITLEQPGLPDQNYAGKGVYKSSDAGATWRLIKGPGNAFEGVVISKIVPHPQNPNIVFVVAQGNRASSDNAGQTTDRVINGQVKKNAVWRTDDGGDTWVDITTRLPLATQPGGSGPAPVDRFEPITDFTLDPSNPNIAYVAIGDPVLYTASGTVFGYELNGVYRTTAALGDPADNNFTVVFGGNGSFIPGSSLGMIRVEVAPSQPSTVYLLVAQPNAPAGGTLTTNSPAFPRLGVFKSTQAGTNFQQLVSVPTFIDGPSGYSGYNLALLVDPTNENRVFIAGRGVNSQNSIFLTEDGGVTWKNVSVDAGGKGPNQTIRDLNLDAAGRLLVATDGGVFRATVSGGTATWTAINGAPGPTSLANTETTGIGLPSQSADSFIVSTYGNGTTRFNDQGDPVTGPIQPGDPRYNGLFSQAVVDPARFGGDTYYDFTNPGTVYRVGSRTTEGIGLTTGTNYVLKSTDNGATWTGVGTGITNPDASADDPAFLIDPSNANRLLFGTNQLWVSENGGGSWSHTLNGQNIPDIKWVSEIAHTGAQGGFLPITALGQSRFDPSVIYVATENRHKIVPGGFIPFGAGLYRINLNFNIPPVPEPQWRDVSPRAFPNPIFIPPDYNGDQGGIVGIAYAGAGAPQAPVDSLIGTIGDGINTPITDIAVDPFDPNVVYITVNTGAATGRIYRTTNGGVTWTDLTGTLPAGPSNTSIRPYTVVIDPNQLAGATDDNIYIGTDVGVWRLSDPTAKSKDPNDPTAPPAFRWTRVGGPYDGGKATVGQLPDVQVRDLAINTTTGILAAGTFGRGVWEFQIRPLISGENFEDLDGNGLRDRGDATTTPPVPADPPLANNTVVAFNIDENAPNANTLTRSNGFYEFRSLRNGNYDIRPGIPGGAAVTSPATTFDTGGGIANPFVTQRTTVRDANLGVFRLASISGSVFDDTNGNGKRDAGEPGIPNQKVVLVADPADPQAKVAFDPVTKATFAAVTATTDAAGNYTFTGLSALQDRTVAFSPTTGYRVIKYVVQVTAPAGSIITSGASGSAPIKLASGAAVTGGDVGEFRLATLRGKVFDDANGNGVKGTAEPPLSGWTVFLDTNKNGKLDAGEPTSVSDSTGSYSFTNLGPGTYRIREVLQAGFVQTSVNPPDTLATSGLDTASLPAAQAAQYDFGDFRLAGLSGTVFEDTNGDGLRQPTETQPIVGATVQLLDPGPNLTDPADDKLLQTTTTDANGGYAFANLFPIGVPGGNAIPYLVRVVQPDAIFVQTSADRKVILTSGINTGGQDLGYFRRTTISGFAFEDVNGNGLRDPGEPAQGGFPITLLNSGTLAVVGQTATDNTGQYVFAGLGPLQAGGKGGAVVPYRVAIQIAGFEQTTADPGDIVLTSGVPAAGPVLGLFRQVPFQGVLFDDLNGNGVRDAGEPGLAGRKVDLITASGQVSRETTTDAVGNYLLNAGPGTFTVRSVSPAGVIQTTADPAFVGTRSGLTVPPTDIGSFTTVSVSGTVFNDLDGNGSQKAGEPAVGGFTVRLLKADGTVVGTAVSDAAGRYSFPNVGPGSYQVQLVNPAGVYATTTNPFPFAAKSGTPVVQNVGTFRAVTVSGRVVEQVAGTPGAAGFTVQLLNAAGQLVATVPSVVTDANGSFTLANVPQGPLTVRLAPRPGWVVFDPQTLAVSPTSGQNVANVGTFVTLRKGSVSGTVFSDVNRSGKQDAIEPGRAGVTVGLFDSGGALVATATTAADGTYQFLNRDPGAYTVRLTDIPGGQSQTSPRGGNFTYTVNLADGSASPTNAAVGRDFGLIGRKRYALAADGGGGPRVQVYDATNGQLLRDTFVYEVSFTGGVRVASADVNGDGVDDLITAAGPGGGPRVRVLDGVTGNIIYDYFAYEPSFRDGLFVSAGDIDGDGFADIITGTSPGGGPRVTVFSGRTGQQIADFFAYDPAFRGGVRVGAADVNGDGRAEVVTGPGVNRDGTGLEPRVITWAFGSPGNPLRQFSSFLAFDETFTGGVYVAGTSLDQDGTANVIVGSGIGYPTSTARVFDGASGRQFYEFPVFDGAQVETRVASFDANGDGIPELVFASGPGIPSRVQILDGKNRREIGNLSPFEPSFLGGVFIG